MVFTHVPMYVDPAADPTDSTTSPRQCQLWDADEVQAVLAKHRHVAAVFTGHYHFGGYARDGHGLHHITLASPLAWFRTTVTSTVQTSFMLSGNE